MLQISSRDIKADLPPSILKKRIKEIEDRQSREEKRNWSKFNTLQELWAWLPSDPNTCEIVHENVLGTLASMDYEAMSHNRIVVNIVRAGLNIFQYMILTKDLPNTSFKYEDKELIILRSDLPL